MNRGDIVVLKSGGPEMTVKGDARLEAGKVECMWFAGDEWRQCAFYPEMLTSVVTCLVTSDEARCPVSQAHVGLFGAPVEYGLTTLDLVCAGHRHRWDRT